MLWGQALLSRESCKAPLLWKTLVFVFSVTVLVDGSVHFQLHCRGRIKGTTPATQLEETGNWNKTEEEGSFLSTNLLNVGIKACGSGAQV